MKASVSPLILSMALAIGLSSPLSAHQETVGKLKIGHPWVRASAEGAPSTYSCIIEISNDGDEAERLLGATIDGAGAGVLYQRPRRMVISRRSPSRKASSSSRMAASN